MGVSFVTLGVVFGLIMAGVAVLAIIGAYQSVRAQMRHHGAIPVMWRWFSGSHHHGREPYSSLSPDRNRPHGKRRLAPRLRRIIYRTVLVFLVPWGAFAYFADKPAIWLITAVFCALLAAEAIRHHWLTVVAARHHRNYVRPMGESIRAVMHPEAMPSNTAEWVTVDRDYSKHEDRGEEGDPGAHPHWAIVDFPRYWNGSDRHKDRIVSIIRETCGMDASASVSWSLDARNSHVEVRDRQPPPKHVTLRDIEPFIEQKSIQDGPVIKNIVLGLGRASAPVAVSLASDSPNLGLSMGAGAGKSQLARLVAAQVLHRGGIVIFLDVKRISHAWARDLPNVRYAKTVADIHDTLLDISILVNQRTEVADFHADWEGNLDEKIKWPRLLIIVEESNEMMARLRRFWMETRNPRTDPVQSPAIAAYEECLFMGRQLLINMLAVAQMMTARASGSGAARENMGVRILGRFSKNNWRMLVPEFEQPERSMHPGRVQVVTTEVRECQVAYMTGAEARDYATSGDVTPFPKIVPWQGGVLPASEDDEVIDAEVVEPGDLAQPDLSVPAITAGDKLNDLAPAWVNPDGEPANDPDWASLRGMLDMLPGKTINILRNDSKRDAEFPKPHPRKVGRDFVYPVDDVVLYYAKKKDRRKFPR